jgi:hypothetical protein
MFLAFAAVAGYQYWKYSAKKKAELEAKKKANSIS